MLKFKVKTAASNESKKISKAKTEEIRNLEKEIKTLADLNADNPNDVGVETNHQNLYGLQKPEPILFIITNLN